MRMKQHIIKTTLAALILSALAVLILSVLFAGDTAQALRATADWLRTEESEDLIARVIFYGGLGTLLVICLVAAWSKRPK